MSERIESVNAKDLNALRDLFMENTSSKELIPTKVERKLYSTPEGEVVSGDVVGPDGGEHLSEIPQETFWSEFDPARLRDRIGELLPDTIAGRHVVMVGAGSGGSYMAEQLVRSGIAQLTIYDGDTVGPENISRSVYTARDVGIYKTFALKRRLLEINPAANITVYTRGYEGGADDFLAKADVVVAGTDNPVVQAQLNVSCYRFGVPAVFPGMTAGASGGEIVLTWPERQTACFSCATATRTGGAREVEAGMHVDYATGRLDGALGLAADIHHVASAATSLVLSILSAGAETPIASLAETAAERGETYLLIGARPNFMFFDKLFESVPGQLAFQSAWIAPASQENCPVCGPEAPYHAGDLVEAAA